MKEFKIHRLWRDSGVEGYSIYLNETELNDLARDGWEVVGFFDEDNLCVLLQREKENKNGLEK